MNGAWRIALLATAAVLSQPANSQQPSSAPQTKIFSPTDGAFQFSYPGDFQPCTRGKMDPCNTTYIPICGQDSLVCVVYPGKEFEVTNFGAASFEGGEIVTEREAMSADVCVTPYPSKDPTGTEGWPEFLISAKH